MTFIDRLDMLLKEHDLNKNQLAAQTGIPVSTIYGWYKKGYEGITLPTITKLAEYFNCTIEYLVNGETHKNSANTLPKGISTISDIQTKRIPLIGNVAAGQPILAEEDYETYIDSPCKADYALRVEGDSMEPGFIDGDIIYIKAQDDVDDGQIAVVLLDDSAALKHVYHIQNGLMLTSDNPKYPPMHMTFEDYNVIRVLGIVVGFTRMFNKGSARV